MTFQHSPKKAFRRWLVNARTLGIGLAIATAFAIGSTLAQVGATEENPCYRRIEAKDHSVGDVKKRIDECTRIIFMVRQDPRQEPTAALGALLMRGYDYITVGRFDDAAKDIGEAAKLAAIIQPHVDAENRFAAAHPFRVLPEYKGLNTYYDGLLHRDSELTVKLARALVGVADDYRYIDTLAAALADAGRFGEAITQQNLAIDRLIAANGNQELLEEMRYRRGLYEQGHPFRDCSLVEAAFLKDGPEKLKIFTDSGQPIKCTPLR